MSAYSFQGWTNVSTLTTLSLMISISGNETQFKYVIRVVVQDQACQWLKDTVVIALDTATTCPLPNATSSPADALKLLSSS